MVPLPDLLGLEMKTMVINFRREKARALAASPGHVFISHSTISTQLVC